MSDYKVSANLMFLAARLQAAAARGEQLELAENPALMARLEEH